MQFEKWHKSTMYLLAESSGFDQVAKIRGLADT